MNREGVNIQIALGLSSCKTIKEVYELLFDVRQHERNIMSPKITEVTYSAQLLRDTLQKLRRRDGLVKISKIYEELLL